MTLQKVLKFIVVLLLGAYVWNKDPAKTSNMFFKEKRDIKVTHRHGREKRNGIAPPTQLITVDLVLTVNTSKPFAFIDSLRVAVEDAPSILESGRNDLRLDWNLTTVCSSNSSSATEYECQCEESFGWPCDICETHPTCNNASTIPTCDCIRGVPPFGGFCESISIIPPCPTPIPPVMQPTIRASIDTVLDIRTLRTEPTDVIQRLREAVESLPLHVTVDFIMTEFNLTTVCQSNFNLEEKCECGEGYLWPCGVCETFGACNNDSVENCDCINTIPPNGIFCLPSDSSTCPTESPPTTTPAIDERFLSFTLDLDFDDSFNDENNNVFLTCSNSIETQSPIHIPGLQSADLLLIRSGSTIIDFAISANTPIQDSAVEALLVGIFNDVRNSFPVVFESRRSLEAVPSEVFFGETVTLACGPPPQNLDFRITSTEWTRDGIVINEDIDDRHNFSRDERSETLTITNFLVTDDGQYQCRLFDGESSFLQESNQRVRLGITPAIRVVPRRNTIVCEVGQEVTLQCSVQEPYRVVFSDISDSDTGTDIQEVIIITQEDCDNREINIPCQEIQFTQFRQNISLVLVGEGELICVGDPDFGNGVLNEMASVPCDIGEVGEMTAVCRESGEWEDREDTCVLERIAQLLFESRFLTETTLPEFLDELSNATVELSEPVTENPNNIEAIVTILNNVASFVTAVLFQISQESMEDVLLTTGVLTQDQAIDAWDTLNTEAVIEVLGRRTVTPRNESTSSLLLFSLEGITSRLVNDSFGIETPLILLNKTAFNGSFNGDFNSTVEIDIPQSNGETNLTVITFESLDNVLVPRDENNASGRVINGRVVLVQSDTTVSNITFTFDIVNDGLGNPQCVFWNFSLFDGLGGWDGDGCELVEQADDTVTCLCDHLTSFSMLMSPNFPNSRILSYITFIGVGISMGSLVLCLIIEAFIWTRVRKDELSHLRNIAIVNIALSLLIANIWFIIGASISEGDKTNTPACTAATFFIHFFYLALFFWMLNFALFLFYHTVNILGRGPSKTAMLIMGFTFGYGIPLLIATLTIAITASKRTYVQENQVCWLNWNQSKALLAFVIPALLIVFINILILIVVLVKVLQSRRKQSSVKESDKHVLEAVCRTLAILTPFFGITWSLGVGTLVAPRNLGIHIAFAFFNSLQGFFVLVFGTLLVKRVRTEIARPFIRFSQATSGSGTKITSTGNSSSILQAFKNIGRGGGNNVSSDVSASSHAGWSR
ncbi:adhesion G protein-coupled receptor F5-like [Hippocampus zosterae]|uniref:adhesion G protein-coupled receptor F5-like n=1 Tax=Hippocampus zosterae TaxID=109293 RepID=UPI00223E371A|nr:adhesion G protein-coupled receptor F5-like [Hippocampus zosterae]